MGLVKPAKRPKTALLLKRRPLKDRALSAARPSPPSVVRRIPTSTGLFSGKTATKSSRCPPAPPPPPSRLLPSPVSPLTHPTGRPLQRRRACRPKTNPSSRRAPPVIQSGARPPPRRRVSPSGPRQPPPLPALPSLSHPAERSLARRNEGDRPAASSGQREHSEHLPHERGRPSSAWTPFASQPPSPAVGPLGEGGRLPRTESIRPDGRLSHAPPCRGNRPSQPRPARRPNGQPAERAGPPSPPTHHTASPPPPGGQRSSARRSSAQRPPIPLSRATPRLGELTVVVAPPSPLFYSEEASPTPNTNPPQGPVRSRRSPPRPRPSAASAPRSSAAAAAS